MPVKEITEDKFYSYNVLKHPMATMIGEEIKWFEDKENNLLGTLIRDKIDKDWSYVLMALEEDGNYRAIEVNASLDSEEIAENELTLKFIQLDKTGEFREELYVEETEKKPDILFTDINDEIKKYLKSHPEKLHDLSPRKFEELVASIFKDLGFDVTLTKATRDGGSDIIASIRNAVTSFLILVECKKYSPENKVGVGIIREVAGVHTLRNPSKSIIVTTSTFTNDAIDMASQLNERIDLKDYNNLKEWLKRY